MSKNPQWKLKTIQWKLEIGKKEKKEFYQEKNKNHKKKFVMRTINLIVLHCTATRATQDFTVEDLKACHLARGFKSIGYHYYITKDGTLYPCRPEREVGAHARHYNTHRHLL